MKLGGWIMMMSGLVLFLSLIGLPTIFTTFLSDLGVVFSAGTISVSNISASTFYLTIVAAFTVIASGGIAIGIFGKGYDVSLALAPIMLGLLLIFIPTFFQVINLVSGYGQIWITSIVSFIFLLLSIGFVMAALDYFGNR